MPEPMNFPVSWDEMHRNAKALAWRLSEKGPWTGIVAVTRGGMVPACIVARELDLKIVETLCISSYDHQAQRSADILSTPQGVGTGEGWIVIDDMVDSGNTFQIARSMMPAAHYACIYAKPAGAKTTDTLITEVSQETWIHFPWDMETRYAEPIAGAPRKP